MPTPKIERNHNAHDRCEIRDHGLRDWRRFTLDEKSERSD